VRCCQNELAKMMKTPVRLISVGTVGALGLYCYQDEGTRRSLQFWVNVFPKYLHYRTIQFFNRDLGVLSDNSAQIYYDQLHEKYTDEVKRLTYKMRGFYLKQAQLMSTQVHFLMFPRFIHSHGVPKRMILYHQLI